jgi:hypothetical protein
MVLRPLASRCGITTRVCKRTPSRISSCTDHTQPHIRQSRRLMTPVVMAPVINQSSAGQSSSLQSISSSCKASCGQQGHRTSFWKVNRAWAVDSRARTAAIAERFTAIFLSARALQWSSGTGIRTQRHIGTGAWKP